MLRTVKSPLTASVVALVLAASAARADMIIDGFTNATNDRFTNDASFIAGAYNLSAIGKSGNRWGTLISSNVIISANHFHPTVGSSITFYATNDPGGATASRTIVAEERLGNTDLWIGILNEPLPGTYQPLAFTDVTLSSSLQFNQSDFADAEIFMVGKSPTSPNVALDTGLGKNRMSSFQSSITVSGATGPTIIALEDIATDSDYVSYEAYLQDQDSGAPMLMDIEGELTIIGMNWFIGSTDIDPSPISEDRRNLTGFSYVGNYGSDIQAIITAYSGVNVPSGYGSWASAKFGSSDLTQFPPNEDADNDGLSNYEEYALNFDPLLSDQHTAGTYAVVNDAGDDFGELTIILQESDNDLNYTVETGSDLIGWDSTSVTYTGSWSTGNASVAALQSSTDNGDGTWTLTLRDPTIITPGNPRFMRVGFDDN